MKKIILILLSVFLLSGCTSSNLDNANVFTTIYPIEYTMNYLYGDNSTIQSIYPNGVNINDYKLTEKQIETYANGDLFVYFGLSNEKEIAKTFINKNRKLLIIDATYGLASDNIEELWLAPNNFLMLVKNIRASLNEYLNNSIKEEIVDNKYNELYEKISWLDAELRNIAKEAKSNGKNTLVISNNALRFLEGYGFNVVSIKDLEESKSENALNDLKSKFKNSTYTTIIKLSNEEDSELITELVNKYKAKTISINSLITNSDSASDYITIQNENISLIRDLLLK